MLGGGVHQRGESYAGWRLRLDQRIPENRKEEPCKDIQPESSRKNREGYEIDSARTPIKKKGTMPNTISSQSPRSAKKATITETRESDEIDVRLPSTERVVRGKLSIV